ncbi:hypothetical protein [Tianweitania sediminis]|uniref:Uncharacterized protein n=1 Tax=Tianweitania sediminis TaxID=1502156 RepID=A0A8J7RRC6_9HYPH|nr:hypothetical protein [Tianweitania sediminis]MBP0440649.1 hypothetical protein [Tianweitania sediminis]
MNRAPITMDGVHNFIPEPTGALAWLARRSPVLMLLVSLWIATLLWSALA